MSAAPASAAPRRTAIGRRPGADPAFDWVHKDAPQLEHKRASPYTARLTIDVTPELRGRIKLAAIRHGATVADMLRDLLEREFPEDAR